MTAFPDTIQVRTSDRALWDEVGATASLPIAEGGIVEAFGRRWHVVSGRWDGFDRGGLLNLKEVSET
jgi:hypothetical protein